MVGAEIARIEGRDARGHGPLRTGHPLGPGNGFVHNEALANELAARFYAARGFERIRACLSAGRPLLLCPLGSRWQGSATRSAVSAAQGGRVGSRPTGTIGAPVEHLDLATVIKVSQAVSGEIVLEKLLDTLMRTAIEHAGAQRGLLILPRGDEQRIVAEATTSGDTVSVHLSDKSLTAAALPESILHYVVRTREAVIVDDAAAENPFAADAYSISTMRVPFSACR